MQGTLGLHLSTQVLHCSLGYWHKLVIYLYQEDGAVHMGAEAWVRVVRGPGVHHRALHALHRHPVTPEAPAAPFPHHLIWPKHIDPSPKVKGVINLIGVDDLCKEGRLWCGC